MLKAFDLSQDLKGKTVLLRAALNVPVENGAVTNPFRIAQALKTVEVLAAKNARVVIAAHIGRGPLDSLRPVYEEMVKRTKTSVVFAEDTVGSSARRAVEALQPGAAVLLENTRRDKREEENDPEFARALAALGDVFVNDAFADAHRAHASIVGVPQHLESFAGPRFIEEYEGIKPALTPPSPSVAIIGGAKFLTKEPVIRALLEKYDRVFVGGALAHDFLLAKGFEIGKSLAARAPQAAELLKNSKLVLPEDAVVEGIDGVETKRIEDVSPSDTIYDVGPASIEKLAPHIEKAKFVLWNGPLGNFERGFRDQTDAVAKLVAEAKGTSVVGGGDTIASIEHLNIQDRYSFVSTAGGAMLHFIAHGTLPGIEVLSRN